MTRRTPALLALPPLLLALAGCASGTTTVDADATPHGFVEGASEHEEPQLGLVGIDAQGTVSLLDLVAAEGEATEIADLGPVDQASTDGRLVAASTADGIAIVDSGVWTVEHGDHSHYYRAQPHVAATIDAQGPVQIASTELVTVVHAEGSDEVVVLDRADLGQGEATELGRFDAAATAAVPLGDAIVVADADGVRLVDHDGASLGETIACTTPTDAVTTRVGVAVACAEGAVLATADDAPLEAIPYPPGVDPSTIATTLDGRPGRPSVAAVAGTAGFWLLDTRERVWTLVPTTTPLAHVAAVDDADEHVVAVGIDGRVLALDASGAELGATGPVLAEAVAAGETPTIELDASRAYVPVAADGIVLEVDYADAARIARTLPLAATYVAEVGR